MKAGNSLLKYRVDLNPKIFIADAVRIFFKFYGISLRIYIYRVLYDCRETDTSNCIESMYFTVVLRACSFFHVIHRGLISIIS